MYYNVIKFKTQREKIKEFFQKQKLNEKKKGYIHKSKGIKEDINKIILERNEIFRLSDLNEKTLKSYIAEINSKLYPKRTYSQEEKKVLNIHNQNLNYVQNLQDWKLDKYINDKYKVEDIAKREFEQLEKKQKEKMEDEINAQLKIFDKMYKEEEKISKIKDDFSNAINNFDNVKDDNFKLKVKKDLLLKENHHLKKLYEELIILNDKFKIKNSLIKNNNTIKTNTNRTNELIPYEKFNESVPINYNQRNSKAKFISLSQTKNKNSTTNFMSMSSSGENFSSDIKSIKNEYSLCDIANFIMNKNQMLNEYYCQIRNRNVKYNYYINNLKKLIGKCIEDLRYENKKIQNFNKQMNKNDLITKIQIISLYNENYINKGLSKLAFIYDNCFIPFKNLTNGISISQSMKNLSKSNKKRNKSISSIKNMKKSFIPTSQSAKNINGLRAKGIRLFTP